MDKVERITVTPDEIRNGWDNDSLLKYLEERNEVQAKIIDPRERNKNRKPIEQNHKYRPLRWRNF